MANVNSNMNIAISFARHQLKHIIAALLTASRLDPRAVPAPAHPPEGPSSQSASGTGVVAEALRALREAEEEASRLREEVKSSSDEN